MPDLKSRLAARIETQGSISVADYMAEANAYYYASRDPLGIDGDFITAPEISQMFGELAGLWLADLWHRAGGPSPCHYVELGPGRGTLAADALRAMATAGLQPRIELVETSPVLRKAQQERLPHASWHDSVESLPADAPLLVVANEFFDALPIRQWVASGNGRWRERTVEFVEGVFQAGVGAEAADDVIPANLRGSSAGAIFEQSEAACEVMVTLCERLARQGGAALIVDYGHSRTTTGDTLQAVRRHAFADPFESPGEQDLTAHVDFEALATAATGSGLSIYGPVAQGTWLDSLGIGARAGALARAAPERAADINAARQRLTGPEGMGLLFKALAVVAPGWPRPAAF